MSYIGNAPAVVTNATSSSKLKTARSIALDGDVSGSVSFDGSADVTITATVADDSHNHTIDNVDDLQAALDNKLETSLKGAANGLAELDGDGLLDKAKLPSSIDADTTGSANKLDGLDSAQFIRSDVDDEVDGKLTHNKDVEFPTDTTGVILTDRNTGTKYRIYVEDGDIGLEEL